MNKCYWSAYLSFSLCEYPEKHVCRGRMGKCIDKMAYSRSKSNFNDVLAVDLMGLFKPEFLSPQVSVRLVLFGPYCMFTSAIWAPLLFIQYLGNDSVEGRCQFHYYWSIRPFGLPNKTLHAEKAICVYQQMHCKMCEEWELLSEGNLFRGKHFPFMPLHAPGHIYFIVLLWGPKSVWRHSLVCIIIVKNISFSEITVRKMLP